jgi:pyruvate/2-oxoglutarate dehydrogenase complex dihydrolipoamide acyltransferase (E2) component
LSLLHCHSLCSLVVPVVRNADSLSFAQVEDTLATLANKVRGTCGLI